LELREDGSLAPICPITDVKTAENDKIATAGRVSLDVYQLLADGRFQGWTAGPPTARATATVLWPMTLLLAAVDPDQEARLVGLDRATVGSSLTAPFKPSGGTGPGATTIPVIASTQSYLDETMSAVASRITGPLADHLAGIPPQQTVAQLSAASALTPMPAGNESADRVYEPGAPITDQPQLTSSPQSIILQSGSTTYGTIGTALVPRSVGLPSDVRQRVRWSVCPCRFSVKTWHCARSTWSSCPK
jgi:putative ABC transport system permease protein